MAQMNHARKELICKIVYWGPGLSGRTTSMEHAAAHLPASSTEELTSVHTEWDRVLLLGFSLPDQEPIAGFKVRYQLCSIPASITYAASRKLLLQGADGIIFMADSQADRMAENRESLDTLAALLGQQGQGIEEIPMVMQWNKRDLPDVLPVSEMQESLNPWSFPSFEATASRGTGVIDSLRSVCEMIHHRLQETSEP
jgi:GTPase SAR1 family protein